MQKQASLLPFYEDLEERIQTRQFNIEVQFVKSVNYTFEQSL